MAVATRYATLGSETALLLTDRLYKADGTKRGMIVCHGRGGHSWDYSAFADPVVAAVVQDGHPVIAPELAGISGWGNAATLAAMANAFAQLQAAGSSAQAPLILSYSMGTLAAFLWAASNPVAAIAAEAPVCDLAAMHDGNLAGYAVEIEGAYGGAAPYAAAVAAHNPAAAPASFRGFASRLYYGNTGGGTDGVVPAAMVTGFAAAIGQTATAVPIGSVSHPNVPASVPVADVVSFLTAHA